MMPTPIVALSPFCISATCHGRRFVGTKYNRNLPVEYTKSEDTVTTDHLSNLPQDATPEDGRIIRPRYPKPRSDASLSRASVYKLRS
jgi:hypothetical protein